MDWKRHHLTYLFGVLLSISLMANVSILVSSSNTSKAVDERITEESTRQQNLHSNPSDTKQTSKSKDPDTERRSKDESVNAATRFITFAFTWEDGTYPTRKRQANLYMSSQLERTLFASSGSDGKFTAAVSDIEVFPSRDDLELCLVRFERTLTIDSNGYEETSDELVELTFTHQDGRYIVDQMKNLKTSGGV